MKATVKTKLGNVEYTFEIDEKSEMDTLHKIAVLGNPPILCDECCNDKPEQFKLGSNKDKEGNCYVYIECLKCTAKAKLGQYKAGGGYFWHHFEKYVKKVA
jgi:hypothetical protein